MSYDYQTERAKLFSEDGVRLLLATLNAVRELTLRTKCTTFDPVMIRVTEKLGSVGSWELLAAIEYLAERGEAHFEKVGRIDVIFYGINPSKANR